MKVLSLALPFSLLALVLAATGQVSPKIASAFGASSFMQQSYELRCRGGGLKFNSTPGRNLSTGEQMMNMTVDFAAGTQAASAYKTLSPGQCSWVDRGFRNGEPRQIRFEIVYFAQQ